EVQPRPKPVLDQHVAVTDAAGFHFDPHLGFARLGDLPLDQFPFAMGLADLCHLHALHRIVFPFRLCPTVAPIMRMSSDPHWKLSGPSSNRSACSESWISRMNATRERMSET